MRLNKYLSNNGVCSRREADRLIEEGRIFVNGEPATLGTRVNEGDTPDLIEVDGKEVRERGRAIYLAVNKPRGVVVTTDRRWGDRLLTDLVDIPERVFPVGRLDKDSEGLILMTNDGDASSLIEKSAGRHEKEYLVKVDGPVDRAFLAKMSGGVYLKDLDRTTAPCKVKKTAEQQFDIVLTQGWNRQIRRMCEACGRKVLELRRIRVMNITLGDLPDGKYRELSTAERDELLRELHVSTEERDS